MIEGVKSLIHDNQFLSGGLVIGIIAGVLASLRKFPSWLFNKIKERFVITIKLESGSCAYDWVSKWLSTCKHSKKFRTVTPHITWVDNPKIPGSTLPAITFAPSDGNHLISFGGKILLIRIIHKDQMIEGMSFGLKKTMEIMKFGKDKAILDKFLQSAYQIYCPETFTEVRIFHSIDGLWVSNNTSPIRSRENVVYADRLIDRIIDDVERFVAKKHWYANMAIPYRRGYLLHGPPGNGKSSLALFLATHLHRHVCVLNISSINRDYILQKLMLTIPTGSIVLLEDIDAAFNKNREEKDKTGITFSGLLNALDGIGTSQGRILVMTTNHKDRLDPAPIRPGRADIHEYIGNATTSQITTMFARFFPESNISQQEQFASGIESDTMSMASLQETLMQFSNPEDALLWRKSQLPNAKAFGLEE